MQEHNGNVLFLLGEGGESRFNTNVNYLLEEYGIMINNDAVVRTAFYKYHHPKECCINNGILCQDIFRLTSSGTRGKENTNNKTLNLEATKVAQTSVEDGTGPQFPFVYPYGATLSVQKPAVPVLSSGPISYPLNRPLCAAAEAGKGRLLVLGSVRFVDDDYIDAEKNWFLFHELLRWCLRH